MTGNNSTNGMSSPGKQAHWHPGWYDFKWRNGKVQGWYTEALERLASDWLQVNQKEMRAPGSLGWLGCTAAQEGCSLLEQHRSSHLPLVLFTYFWWATKIWISLWADVNRKTLITIIFSLLVYTNKGRFHLAPRSAANINTLAMCGFAPSYPLFSFRYCIVFLPTCWFYLMLNGNWQ